MHGIKQSVTASLTSRQPMFSGDFRFEADKGSFTINMNHVTSQITSLHFRENGKYSGIIMVDPSVSGMLFAQADIEGNQDITLEIDQKERSNFTLVFHAHIQQSGNLQVRIKTSQKKSSNLHIVFLQTSLGISNLSVESLLSSENSHGEIHTINIQKGSSSGEVQVLEKALSSHCFGSILERAILFDSAQCTLQGNPLIEKNALSANMALEQKTLLMGEKTRILSRPLLSVSHNEVQAHHSASVSTLSEEDLFYLMSHGLSTDESKQLIVDGFIHELFSKIPSQNVQNCLEENIKQFL